MCDGEWWSCEVVRGCSDEAELGESCGGKKREEEVKREKRKRMKRKGGEQQREVSSQYTSFFNPKIQLLKRKDGYTLAANSLSTSQLISLS